MGNVFDKDGWNMVNLCVTKMGGTWVICVTTMGGTWVMCDKAGWNMGNVTQVGGSYVKMVKHV